MILKNDIQAVLNAILIMTITILLTAITMEKGFGIHVKSWGWLSSLIIFNSIIGAIAKKIF